MRHQNGNHRDFLEASAFQISGPNSILEFMELSQFVFSFEDF